MKTTTCLSCKTEIEFQRITKKFCSRKCSCRHRNGYPRSRTCLECGSIFQVLTQQADANKKYCAERCSKRANNRIVKKWIGDHPDARKKYTKTRLEKFPGMWRDKARAERLESLRILGGACCVCGVKNPNWLHVDYVPTRRGKGGRHARHLAFVKRNLKDFRILCANHHYELTLTGKIKGTEITQ